MRPFKLLAYLWAAPTTLLGLLFVPALMFGGGVRCVDGVLEVHGRVPRWFLSRLVGVFLQGGASAMTLGHVVVARDSKLLEQSRRHERVHVRQCERWGPLFIPAYVLMSAYIWFRGLRAYEDNPFEREAFLEAPG